MGLELMVNEKFVACKAMVKILVILLFDII